MLDVQILTSRTAKRYRRFTYEVYRSCLKQLSRDHSLIGIGLQHHGQPIGLALGHYDQHNQLGEICSLFVHPEHRNQGGGKMLLMAIETQLMRRGCSRVQVVYMPNGSSGAFQKILTQRGWSNPQPRMLVCQSTLSELKHLPWLTVKDRLRSSCEVFPWVNLTESERERIQARQEATPWYPPILCPFREEDCLEPLNSLGLRYHNEVVGWMVTHRIDAETIRYTSLFVREDLQGLGYAIPLLAQAIQLQLDDQMVFQTSFAVAVDNTRMMSFVQRRLQPYMTTIRQSMESRKQFSMVSAHSA